MSRRVHAWRPCSGYLGRLTWCGATPLGVELYVESVAERPDQVTCKRCRSVMHDTHKALTTWLGEMERER